MISLTQNYGIVEDPDGDPIIKSITNDEQLMTIDMADEVDVNSTLASGAAWNMGVEIAAGSTATGNIELYVSAFTSPVHPAKLVTIPVTDGEFEDGTQDLFIYKFCNGAPFFKFKWVPTLSTGTNTMRVKFYLNPLQI